MMEDNIRYTAMRIFQDIEGADVIYINTYAATTPRLQTFKKICSTNSKEPELVESTHTDQKQQRMQHPINQVSSKFSKLDSSSDDEWAVAGQSGCVESAARDLA